MPVLVGTSGWQYKDWKGDFYPPGTPTAEWLAYYSSRFCTVEVNNAFYRLPERSVFEHWRSATPAGFVMAVKASRYLTHVKRLSDPAEPVARLLEHADGLGGTLGPVLLQLPPTLKLDLARLDKTLSCFPRRIRVAVEFRHASWFVDDTAAVLSQHSAAFCMADSPKMRTPFWRTAEWGYVRFHEGRASPHPAYGRTALTRWADRLKDMFGPAPMVYAYFNNDTNACAPRNAATFRRMLDRRSMTGDE